MHDADPASTDLTDDMHRQSSELVAARHQIRGCLAQRVENCVRALDIRIRYKQAVMGIGWAVITSAVVALAGCIMVFAFGSLGGNTPSNDVLAGIDSHPRSRRQKDRRRTTGDRVSPHSP